MLVVKRFWIYRGNRSDLKSSVASSQLVEHVSTITRRAVQLVRKERVCGTESSRTFTHVRDTRASCSPRFVGNCHWKVVISLISFTFLSLSLDVANPKDLRHPAFSSVLVPVKRCPSVKKIVSKFLLKLKCSNLNFSPIGKGLMRLIYDSGSILDSFEKGKFQSFIGPDGFFSY